MKNTVVVYFQILILSLLSTTPSLGKSISLLSETQVSITGSSSDTYFYQTEVVGNIAIIGTRRAGTNGGRIHDRDRNCSQKTITNKKISIGGLS